MQAPAQTSQRAARDSKGHAFVRLLLFLSSFSWTLNPVTDYVDGGAPMEKVLTRMLPLVVVALYCLMGPHREALRRFFSRTNTIIIWYIFWGVSAGITSPSPLLCLWKGAEIFILMMWICVSCRDRESTLREYRAMVFLIEVLLYFTVLLALINPALGLRKSATIIPWLQGYLPLLNPNAVGICSAIALVSLLFCPAKNKAVRIAIISCTLLFSQSRTSYVAIAIALLLFTYAAFRKRNVKHIIIALIATTLGLGLALGMLDTIMNIFMRGQSSDQLDSLSGRTSYWEVALSQVGFIGGGFATGSRFLDQLNPDVFHKFTVNLHNSHIEALVSAGIIGATPYLINFAYQCLRQALRIFAPRDPEDILFIALAVIIVLRSITSIVEAVYSADLIVLMLFFAYTRYRNPKRATGSPQNAPPKTGAQLTYNGVRPQNA